MGCARISAIVGLVAWALISRMGLDIIGGAAAQHVAGLPSATQLNYYVYFPAAMTGAALSLVLLLAFQRVPAVIKTSAAGATVIIWLIMPVFLLFYTGGV